LSHAHGLADDYNFSVNRELRSDKSLFSNLGNEVIECNRFVYAVVKEAVIR
jgi:hypothetical protein